MVHKPKFSNELSSEETYARQTAELLLLDKVRSAVMSELELPAVIRAVVEAIAETFDYRRVAIFLSEDNELIKQHAVGYENPPEVMELGKGIVGRVARTGKAELVEDVSLDPDYIEVASEVLSEIVIPLSYQGLVEGILSIEGGVERQLTEDDLRMMSSLGDHIVLAIKNSKLYEAERQQRTMAESYSSLSAALNRTLQLDDVLELILVNLNRVVPFEAANIMMIEDGIGRVAKSYGYEKDSVEQADAINRVELPIADTADLLEILKTGQPYIIQDVEKFPNWIDATGRKWIRSHLGAPIKAAGEMIGFLNLDDPEPNKFDQEDAQNLLEFCGQVSIAIQNARLFDRVQRELEERRSTEQALINSERVLKKSQEIGHIGSWRLDLRKNELIWSDEVYRIFGLEPQEFGETYEAFLDAVHPDDREMVDKGYTSAIANHQPYEIVHRVLRPDGEVRVVREKSEEGYDQDGNEIYSIGMVHDITERVQAEEALERSEQRYRDLFENANDLIQSVGPDGKFQFVNRKWLDSMGYTEKEVKSLHFEDIIHTEHLDAYRNVFQRLLKGENINQFKTIFMTKSGHKIHVEGNMNAAMQEESMIATRGIFRDVTERKHASQALARQANELALLDKVRSTLMGELELSAIFRTVLDAITETFDYRLASISLLEGDMLVRQYSVGDTKLRDSFPVSKGIMGRAARSAQPQLVEDVSMDRDYLEGAKGVVSEISIPLFDESQVVGVLNIESNTIGELTRDDLKLMVALGENINIAIKNGRLYEAERDQRNIAEAHAEIAAALSSTLNLDEILDLILINLERVIPYDAANIMLIESGAARMVRARGYEKYGAKEAKAMAEIRLPISEVANMMEMVATGRAHIIPDVRDYPGWVDRKNGRWIRAHLGAPIRVGEETIGFLHLDDPNPNVFTEEHAALLQVYSNQVAIALYNGQLFERVEHSEERYRTLFEAPFEAIVLSEGGVILETNQAFELMYGYSREEVKGMPVFEFVAEESRETVGRAIREQKDDIYEVRSLRKDGTEFPVEVHAKYIEYQGRVVRVAAIRDLSERKRAEEEIKQRNRDLAILNTISVAINESMRLDEILEIALQEIVSSTEVDGAECHLLDEEGKLALRMVYGLDVVFAEDSLDFRFPVGEGIPGRALKHRKPVYVSNAQTDKRYLRRELAKAAGYCSLLCVPFLGSKGVLGTFMLYSREPREFPSEMQTLLMTVGRNLAAAVNNAQMYDAQQQIASRQTTLYETLETIGEHLDPETVIQTAVEKIAELTGWPVVNILIPDESGDLVSMLIVKAWGGPESHDYREFEIPIHGGITGRAFRTNQTQNVGNVSVDPDYIERDAVIKSELSVPLRHGDRTLGLLDIQSKRLNGFKEEDVLLVESLADAIALTLENANLFTQAQTEIRERISADHALRELNESLENRVEERTEELQKSLDQVERTLEGVVLSIARIVEMRDPYTAGHQARVAKLAQAIAIEMKLADECVTALHRAALIHDVGKINIPTEILSKPGKLTDAEYGIIKEHVQIGKDIVSTIEFPLPVAEFIGQHHERMNGSGYPEGISGDEILTESRILAVADVVEAMTAERPYRAAMDIEFALKDIKKNAGKLFDKPVVKACLDLFRKKNFKF